MIKTTYSGEDFYLLDIAPTWRSGFKAQVALVGNVETSLTNREARRGLSGTVRCVGVEYDILASGADARRVAAALQAMTDERVLVPLWPAAVLWGDRVTAPITGGLRLAFKDDFSWFEIYEVVEPLPPEGGVPVYTAPLLMGRFADGTANRQVTWRGPELLEWQVKFTENSPAKYAIGPGPGANVVFTAGPLSPAGQAAYLFPFEVNFAQGHTENFSIVLIREGIGFGREAAETFYLQVTARELGTNYFVSQAADAGRLLGFFLQHATGKSFWTSDWVSAAVLTADVGAGDTVLHVSDVMGIVDGDFVLFYGATGMDGPVKGARVQSHDAGAKTVTLSAALGAAFAAGSSMLMGLVLCRFRTPAMELQWVSGEHLQVTIPTREVSEEYEPAADETLGTTIGKLPDRCYLYQFSRVLNTVIFTDRFTSYENDLSYGGNNYLARKVTHGDVNATLYLGQDEVQIKTDVFAGNPLLLPAQLNTESVLLAKIIEAEVDGADAVNASVLFSGEVMSAKMSGSRITGTVVSGGRMFDRKLPRAVFGVMCNACLFDDYCSSNGGPTAALWKFTATVHDPGSAGYPFDFVIRDLAGVGASAIAALGSVGANFFALGWAEFRTGAGDELNWCRRAILQNSALEGGIDMTLTLKRDPLPFPAVGDTVVLYPGCDLTAATCKAKFNNYPNFFGHPYIPISNPTMSQAGKPSGGGKK